MYHELLHNFLVDNYESLFNSSALIQKYKSEAGTVLSHLHLMAVQKKIYLELGWQKRIEEVIEFDSKNYGDGYRRAWEIVNLEGEDAFIGELFNAPKAINSK